MRYSAALVIQGDYYAGLLVYSHLAENYVFLGRKYAVQYSTQHIIFVYTVSATSTIVCSVICYYICRILAQVVDLLWFL